VALVIKVVRQRRDSKKSCLAVLGAALKRWIGKDAEMNLFIIGAGFTKALFPKAPLNQELLRVLAKSGTDSASQRLLERYQTDDIEIALTKLDADIALSHTRPKETGDELPKLRREIENELGNHFECYRASSELVSTALWLSHFIRHVISDGDVVVNLNYDCVFEGALDCLEKWSLNGGYGPVNHSLVSDEQIAISPVTVLKIHGSVTFRIAPYLDKPQSMVVGFAINEGFFPRSGENRHFEYGLGKGESYLIAPSYVKVATLDIAYLMLDALKAASKAKNLVIIGCSLRPEDTFLTLLLTDFLRQPNWRERRIMVVDPQAEAITSRIKTYWGVKIPIITIEGPVEESVEQLLKTISA
jgi:hypothetical protein